MMDVADSWEDADTEDLEKRMELRQRHSESRCVSSDSSSQAAGSVIQQPPLRVSEWKGTQYVPPVKILKRPAGETTSTEKSSVEPEYKSLAQREAEYATAREFRHCAGETYTKARILGTSSKGNSSKRETRTVDN